MERRCVSVLIAKRRRFRCLSCLEYAAMVKKFCLPFAAWAGRAKRLGARCWTLSRPAACCLVHEPATKTNLHGKDCAQTGVQHPRKGPATDRHTKRLENKVSLVCWNNWLRG